MLITNSRADSDLHSYWYNEINPILLKYDGDGEWLKKQLDGKLHFGDSKRQPVDYYKIDLVDNGSYTGRFCFNAMYGFYGETEEGVNNPYNVYKYPSSALIFSTFDCTYNVTQFSKMNKYQIGFGDVDEYLSTQVNSGFYVFPVVFMPEFYETDYVEESRQIVYLSVESITVKFNLTPSIYNLIGNTVKPVVILNSSYNQYFLNAIMGDDRYTYRSRQYAALTLKMGQMGNGTEIHLPNQYMGVDLAPKRLISIDHEGYRYYNTAINPIDLQYIISDYTVSFENQLVDSMAQEFDYYMRVGVYESYDEMTPDGTLQGYFNNAPFSASAYILYKPQANLEMVNNGGFSIGNLDAHSLYRSTAIEYNKDGNLFQDIANFFTALFTVTIPNIVNNFIVWFMLEAPLISNVTKPLYTIGYTTGSVITQFMLPLVSALGVLGVAFVLVIVIRLIVRLFK